MQGSALGTAIARAALVGLTACAWSDGARGGAAEEKVCTLDLRTALAVEIHDERGRLADPTGVTVVVRGPAFHDSVTLTRDVSDRVAQYIVMEDRAGPGRYDIRVQRPGYHPWERRGIVVAGDECHVTARAGLTAVLEPLGR